MQLFQPCSSPEQSKAIADLSSGLDVGSEMTFCALSSVRPTVGSAGSGITFCAQPAMPQARANAIEALSCTLFFNASYPFATAHWELRVEQTPVVTHITPQFWQTLLWVIQSGGDMCLEAQINVVNTDLHAFSRDEPAIEAPTAGTDRMHVMLVMRADTP
jgi:hypothetical protein